MAKYGSDDVKLLIAGYDLSGVTGELMAKVERLTEETHGFGDTWTEVELVGLRRAEFEHKGWYTDGAAGSNAALVSLAGTSRVGMALFEGDAKGQAFMGFSGLVQADFERIVSLGKLHRANAKHAVDGAVEHGRILTATATRTTTANSDADSLDGSGHQNTIPITSSSVANPTVITTSAPHGLTTGDVVVISGHSGSTPAVDGQYTVTVTSTTTFTVPVNVTVGGTGGTVSKASSQSGGAIYAQITALTLDTATGFTLKLKDSADNVTFADKQVMTTQTSAPAGIRTAVSGTIRRYTSMTWTFDGGAGAGSTATFITGLYRA